MSNFIKFSTLDYYKLEHIDKAHPLILLEVFPVSSQQDLSKSFLEYDTKYKDDETLLGESYYPLSKVESLLVLLFMDSQRRLFTTIRSRFGKCGDKYSYYRSKRNCHFWIEKVGE
jgi:hypothetical protein